MKTISHSGLVLVRNCLRQYMLSYVLLKKVRSTAPALSFGRLWDDALQEWHKGASAEERLALAMAVLIRHSNDLQRETAIALMVGYTARWGDAPLRIKATQVQFTVPILNQETGEPHPEYQYTGILDGIGEDERGGLILESKTTSSDIEPGSPYWQHITTLEPQGSMYLAGAKQSGWDADRIVWDVTRKPALRQKTKETAEEYGARVAQDIQARPDWYFQRREVVRLEADARAYQQDLWDYACILSEAEGKRRFPRNPDRCRQWGRACDFLPVCVGEASIDDPILFTTRERGPSVVARKDPKGAAA